MLTVCGVGPFLCSARFICQCGGQGVPRGRPELALRTDIMRQQPWHACGRPRPGLRLRGWLARYVWPSYDQARFIEAAKRDMEKLIEGEPELN
jgi:hypothetical protein